MAFTGVEWAAIASAFIGILGGLAGGSELRDLIADAEELADAWHEAYLDAQEYQYNIVQRQLAISRALADCYCNVTYANLVDAYSAVLAFQVPEVDCGTFPEMDRLAQAMSRQVKSIERRLGEQHCVNVRRDACDTDLDTLATMTALDASQAMYKLSHARQMRVQEQKFRLMSRVKAGLWTSPEPINQFINNASTITNNLVQLAASGEAGAASAAAAGGAGIGAASAQVFGGVTSLAGTLGGAFGG